jgi:transcriptional regulator GlxA family with amidase domain
MSTAAYSDATPVPTLAGSIRVGSNETVARLLAAATAAFDSDRDAAKACIARAAALLQVSPHQQQLKTVHPRATLGGLAPWQAKRVSTYIEANLGSRIRAADLAEIAQRSTSHFSRAFRESFGTTPLAYVAKERIQRAQAIMLTSREPLSEIALACGLCDQPHFTRVFRRVVGLSPGAWRRQFSAG